MNGMACGNDRGCQRRRMPHLGSFLSGMTLSGFYAEYSLPLMLSRGQNEAGQPVCEGCRVMDGVGKWYGVASLHTPSSFSFGRAPKPISLERRLGATQMLQAQVAQLAGRPYVEWENAQMALQ
jgi:hypothetical protein